MSRLLDLSMKIRYLYLWGYLGEKTFIIDKFRFHKKKIVLKIFCNLK